MLRRVRRVLPWAPAPRGGAAKRSRDLPAQLPRCGADAGAADVEAALAEPPRRRVAAPAHGMEPQHKPVPGRDEQAAQTDVLHFYDTEVQKVQQLEGDKDHAPIQGNLYRYMALRKFGQDSGLIQTDATAALLMGLYLVVFTQIFAPVFILVWVYSSISCGGTHCFGVGEWRFDGFHSDQYGVSHIFARILGLVFIIIYCMNGAFNMHAEKVAMRKTLDMADIFNVVATRSEDYMPFYTHVGYRKITRCWLWLDPFVNIWCFALTAVALVPLFSIAQDGPKEVVYDAFALLFLFNLDDIGGDLAFLDEKWDEEIFGDIFGRLADQAASDDFEEGALLKDIRQEREQHLTPDNLYELGSQICWLLLIILPLFYMFSEIRSNDIKVSQEQLDAAIASLRKELRGAVDQSTLANG